VCVFSAVLTVSDVLLSESNSAWNQANPHMYTQHSMCYYKVIGVRMIKSYINLSGIAKKWQTYCHYFQVLENFVAWNTYITWGSMIFLVLSHLIH